MMNKIILFIKKNIITIIFSSIAIGISLFSLRYAMLAYDDKKINTELWINIYRFKSLVEYENRIMLVFSNNSVNIINMFKREKGVNFINENINLVEYIYLSKITYDLVNDSYEQFFIHNNMKDIYDDVGRAIHITDVVCLSEILWNNNNLNNISYDYLDRITDNITILNNDLRKEKLNSLLVKIDEEKQNEIDKINFNYYKALKKNNLEKELIEDYYRLNKYYNGLTLAQKDWFAQRNGEKLSKIESYLNSYFSPLLNVYFIEELFNKK